MKFYYHAESDAYITGEKHPGDLCEEITFQQYCAGRHPNLYVYDIEVYPNVFTVTIIRPSDVAIWRFRICPMVNQGVEFFTFLTQVRESDGRMVGFNNIGYDYPVIHRLIQQGGHVYAADIYEKSSEIINSDDRFGHIIWSDDRYVEQVDLFKIHHFDNVAKSTSLKMLEFNMRADSIQDLPFEPGRVLTAEEIEVLIQYNDHDVHNTVDFLAETIPMLEFRDELSAKYERDFTNHNDTKIGEDYFIMELERQGVECYHRPNGRREPRQTVRPSIDLNSVIFPWVQFQHPEFQRVLNWLRSQTIVETKGVFKDLSCVVNGFQYDFGTGGIHGSVDSQIVSSDEQYVVIDLDVASYYPNLAIANNLYPEHLGRQFCDIYLDVYNQRRNHAKGTPENAMLKLALNGVYGKSNSDFSCFYDPAYTMAITINGQLLLCLLAEYLSNIPDLTMVQINTDGLTVRCPREHQDTVMFIAQTWEELTGLTLERVDYNRMFIRDVNNYIGEYLDGKLKRKSAYCYGPDLDWHQNHSSQIIAMAAEAALVHGENVEQFIRNHPDTMDFMLRTKVPRNSRLEWGDTVVQNITRYYVSNNGQSLTKVMPPTPAQIRKYQEKHMVLLWVEGQPHTYVEHDSKDYHRLIRKGYQTDNVKQVIPPDRRIGINAGWSVTCCNNLRQHVVQDINYDYYIGEARKLVDKLTSRS